VDIFTVIKNVEKQQQVTSHLINRSTLDQQTLIANQLSLY